MKTKKIIFSILAALALGAMAPEMGPAQEAVSPQETETDGVQPPAYELEKLAILSLEQLAMAYSSKQRGRFMRLVSDDFQGDVVAFEDALLRDFRQYRNVDLHFIPDTVTVSSDKAEVVFRYNMSVIDNQGTQTLYSGNSAYEFKFENNQMKLVRMNRPILFGNSLPSSENPLATAQGAAVQDIGTSPGPSGNLQTGTAVVALGVNGFRFSSQSGVSEGSADVLMFGGSGQGVETNFGGGLESLGIGSLSSVTSVPNNPSGQFVDPVQVGQLIAVKTLDGKYAVIRVTDLVANVSVSFEFKYQPNGTSSF